jgi:hypothetical protein
MSDESENPSFDHEFFLGHDLDLDANLTSYPYKHDQKMYKNSSNNNEKKSVLLRVSSVVFWAVLANWAPLTRSASAKCTTPSTTKVPSRRRCCL